MAAIKHTGDVTGPEPARAASPAPWGSVVFWQDQEADEVLSIIDTQGVDAGIDHLAQWDVGRETKDAAVMAGHVSSRPLSEPDDHEYLRGHCLLIYNHATRHTGLLRRRTPTSDAADPPAPPPLLGASGPDRPSSRRPSSGKSPGL